MKKRKSGDGTRHAGVPSEGIGSVLELFVERLLPGGEGLARHEGKAVFVPLSAPGERLRVRVSSGGADWLRADIQEVLEPSSERSTAPCPLYGVCGGCDLMHLEHRAQIEAKRGFLLDALCRSGGLKREDLPAEGVRSVSGQEYGTRARFQFHGVSGGPGLARRASAAFVPLQDCPVATEEVRSWLGGKPAMGEGLRLTAFGARGRFFLQGRDAEATCELGGRDIAFPMDAFFQSNPAALERLILELQDDPGGASLADLYGGVGTLSTFLSPLYGHVTVVESDRRAAGFAERNFPAGSRPEVQAIGVDEWLQLPSSRRSFDTVLCDPPRGGLSSRLRAWLAERRFRRLAYLSCDPVTLARDLGALKASYRVTSLSLHDFYPQTAHVETLAVLEARP